MPIEIRELVIRTTLEEKKKVAAEAPNQEQLRKAIVKDCVEQVLEKLQEQHTR